MADPIILCMVGLGNDCYWEDRQLRKAHQVNQGAKKEVGLATNEEKAIMIPTQYSKRLGAISPEQFQAALNHFGLGQFLSAEAIPFGLFGQNVFVTSSTGEYVFRGAAHYDWQFPKEQFVANLLHERTNVPVP